MTEDIQGQVRIDKDGDAWQFHGAYWHCSPGDLKVVSYELETRFGPTTLIYTPPQDPPPAHLVPTRSDRGFIHLPKLPGAYGGDVRVYESSAASSPHIWLSAGDREIDITLHLTLETAQQLIEQAQWLLANHYQIKDRTDGN